MIKTYRNIIRKNLILILSFFILQTIILCQVPNKYEDIAFSIKTLSLNDAFLLLSKYQKTDPTHPVCYYELGKISHYWLKEFDPLTEYNYVLQFAYNANLYYGLAHHYMDERSGKKYREYFPGVKILDDDKKVEFDDIKFHIDQQMTDTKNYEKNIKEIFFLFNNAVSFYGTCNQLFKKINTGFNKIKDIYLSTDENLINNLEQLAINYDSSIYYLNKYQQKIKEFPIGNYNQKYKTKKIITYRLDGLTVANFLENDIDLWDYNSWVQKINKVKKKNINELRTEILLADKELNASIDFFKYSRKNDDNLTAYKVNEMLKFKIGKFDHQSIVLDLFNYKESKLNFLVSSRKKINSIDDTAKISFLQRSRYYQSLLNEWLTLSEFLNILSTKINEYHINKYYDFFELNYSGIEGFNKFISEEKQINEREINLAFSNLKFFLQQENNKYTVNLNFAPYKNYNIPLFVKKPDYNNLIPKQLISINIDEDSEGNQYITGIYLPENKNFTQAFVAKLNSNNIVQWLQFINSKDATATTHQIGKIVQALDDGGCIVIVNLFTNLNGEKVIQNHLVKLNNSGKIIKKSNLYRNFIPQFFRYDEINENYIICYKGNNLGEPDILENLYIDFNDSTRNNVWNQTMEIKGNIINIINLNQDYLVFANISQFVNNEGKLIDINSSNSLNNNTTLLYSYLENTGNIKHLQIYNAQESYLSTKVVKLHNTMINILGYKGSYSNDNINITGSEPLFYMLIKPSGVKIYSNLN